MSLRVNDILNMESEELAGLFDDSLDLIDYERIATKIVKDYSNKILYGGLTHNYNLNAKTEVEKLKYKNKIGYSLTSNIKEMLTARGRKYLLIANAGGGKTYTILKSSSELNELDKDAKVVYILAVPNTSQSNQNQVNEDLAEFGFLSIVGEKSKLEIDSEYESITEMLKAGHRKYSCVFDKVIDVIEESKKMDLEVVLVVDEAHKLVWDTYRGEALEGMDKSIELADMVLMMTATADVCKHYYQYNKIFELEDTALENNIKDFKVIYSNNWGMTLRRELRRLKKKNKIALIKIGCSIEKLNSLKTALEKQGYLVEILSSKNKNGYAFKTIEQFGLIGADVDIVLTTSVVECGISLKDKDIVPIEIIRKAHDFNLDNSTQFFARPRKKVSEGIMIVKSYNENIGAEIVEFENELKKNKNAKPKTKNVRKIEHCINEVKREASKFYSATNSTIKKS